MGVTEELMGINVVKMNKILCMYKYKLYYTMISHHRDKVRIAAIREMQAHISITEPPPKLSANGSNMLAPTKAPAFPHAADIPFKVVRHSFE